jgi:hypothetical protein
MSRVSRLSAFLAITLAGVTASVALSSAVCTAWLLQAVSNAADGLRQLQN